MPSISTNRFGPTNKLSQWSDCRRHSSKSPSSPILTSALYRSKTKQPGPPSRLAPTTSHRADHCVSMSHPCGRIHPGQAPDSRDAFSRRNFKSRRLSLGLQTETVAPRLPSRRQRKPILLFSIDGLLLLRCEARTLRGLLFQLPPRSTYRA